MNPELLRLAILMAFVFMAQGHDSIDLLIDVRDGRCIYYDGSQLPTFGEGDCFLAKPDKIQCGMEYGQVCHWIQMTEEEMEEFKAFRYELMVWAYEEFFGVPPFINLRQKQHKEGK